MQRMSWSCGSVAPVRDWSLGANEAFGSAEPRAIPTALPRAYMLGNAIRS
jgi:hypothetical protein